MLRNMSTDSWGTTPGGRTCCRTVVKGEGVAQFGWNAATPRPKDGPAAAGAPGEVPAGQWPTTSHRAAEVAWCPSWHRFRGVGLVLSLIPARFDVFG